MLAYSVVILRLSVLIGSSSQIDFTYRYNHTTYRKELEINAPSFEVVVVSKSAGTQPPNDPPSSGEYMESDDNEAAIHDIDSSEDHIDTRKYTDNCCARICKITIDSANCESGGCTCVPQDLPHNITALYFRRNLIVKLKDYTFYRYSNLKTLIISYNKIKTISSKAFYGLNNLTNLMLNSNPIQALVDNLFSSTPLLKSLYLSAISRNIFNSKAFINLTRLNLLSMKYDGLKAIPNFKINTSAILTSQNLRNLYLRENEFINIGPNDFASYPNLRYLELDKNKIYKVDRNTFKNMSKLKKLNLAFNNKIQFQETSLDNSNLRELYLLASDFLFKKKCNFLGGLPLLERLTLDRTKVRNAGLDDIRPNPLENLTNLNYLSMKRLQLKDDWIYIYLQNLTKLDTLDVTANFITKFNKSMFASLPQNMTKILFISNKITKVLRYHVPDWMWHSKDGRLQFHFHGNPFNCDCDILWLKRWLNQKNGGLKITTTTEYRCFTPPELKGQLIQNLKSITIVSCFSVFSTTYVRILVSTSIVVIIYLVAAIVAIIHKYRWHARYFLFVYKNKWRQRQRQKASEDVYEYDAFISYCAADRQWVVEHLGAFENEAHLKFCFHDRDWTAGRYIMENMLRTMQSSRKLIFIVSNAFCLSTWCQDELQLAHSHLVEARLDNVVLVLREHLDDDIISETLRLYLNRTYIEWPSEEARGTRLGLTIFWSQLRRAIEAPVLGSDEAAADEAYNIQIQQRE